MCEIICITNRTICGEEFLVRLGRIAAAKPKAVVLREKDMPPEDYKRLAIQAKMICMQYGVPCILHSYADIAAELKADGLHMPLAKLREMTDEEKSDFAVLGASVHSPEEAEEAEALGATYITAGHVFPTDCKKGLPPRGLEFLKKTCAAVNIPVYAIGGVCSGNYSLVRSAGAAGACVMSGLMTCTDPEEYLERFRKESDSE
jgi:thiamine-phosphate pyrophosphorylase